MARQRTAKGPSSPAWVRGYPRGALAAALLACFIGMPEPSAARSESAMLDLSRAVVVTPKALTGPERKAVELLVEDVARRSGIRWKVLSRWPAEPFSTRTLPSSAQYRGTAARARESLASYTSVCSWHPSLPMASTGHSSRAARQEACWTGSWGW